MVTDKQEKAFKDLIKSTGHEAAPEFILNTVIQRLENEDKPRVSTETTLIHPWIFVTFIIMLFSFTAYLITTTQGVYFPELSTFSQFSWELDFSIKWLPELQISNMITMILIGVMPALLLQFYFMNKYLNR